MHHPVNWAGCVLRELCLEEPDALVQYLVHPSQRLDELFRYGPLRALGSP
jgi:hypothetical protein